MHDEVQSWKLHLIHWYRLLLCCFDLQHLQLMVVFKWISMINGPIYNIKVKDIIIIYTLSLLLLLLH